MTEWKIVTDSGSAIRTLPTNKNIKFDVAPLTIRLGQQEFVDDAQLDLENFVQTMHEAKEKSSSACPSPDVYAQHFEGANKIICFTITGQLSGSFNSARIGATLAQEKNNSLDIYIHDSRSAGGEMDLLIHKAVELIEENPNQSIEELAQKIQAYHENTHVAIMLESVKNLANNGRVSKLISAVIGMMGIRLIGTRTNEGTIELNHKVRGQARGIRAMVDDMVKNGYRGGRIYLNHILCESLAQEVSDEITKLFPDADIHINCGSALCSFYAETNGIIIGYETI